MEFSFVLGIAAAFVGCVAAVQHIRRSPKGDWAQLFQDELRSPSSATPALDRSRALWLLFGRSGFGVSVLSAIGEQLGEAASIESSQDSGDLAERLLSLCSNRRQRLIVVATGESLVEVLDALANVPQARDALEAVVSVGGVPPKTDGEYYTHKKLDVEMGLPVPYFSVSMTPESDASFPTPADDDGIERSILRIHLGTIDDTAGHTPERVAAALVHTVAVVTDLGR